ncbi:MAG: methylenetetrahydrofolate--tRNA-(uracil(54)-C(5))-methyltransferase (FADH(2)-oxidizing) TrmFO [Deltaproteobacteria bacterium]|nr:methylenetetrahydrofolate--tRNA-(uracil(54)-C(5))-methyltransferase (FADH(2)-oxidizing) TrmFO [Deltaproteobacteria bacterium]
MSEPVVTIIGAGLAGSEAAWQLVKRGHRVRIIEMRPLKMTKAHKTGNCAELVCSNSFRGAALTNAVGLLKEELRRAGSLVLEAAAVAEVPAGGALAVDREVFSKYIDARLRSHPLISFENAEVSEIPATDAQHPAIIATGPLTSLALARAIEARTGTQSLAFFDAISPIMLDESLDHEKLFRQSRYGKGSGDDYLNIPLSEEQYRAFVDAVDKGEKFGGHDEVESDKVDNLRPFEGCMPIEEMVARGPDTLRFGPMKPVGLEDPKTGRRPYAAIQLRQDDKEGKLWSMVGFQTKLKHGEQMRIFKSLPGLENAEFVRLGSVHRNTFLDSPKCLSCTLEFRAQPALFFAGQITGVEGYVESTAGGFVAGVNAGRLLEGKAAIAFPGDTAMGSLLEYISDPERKEFQPMNISFGLMKSYLNEPFVRHEGKDARRLRCSERALASLKQFLTEIDILPSESPSASTSL